MKAKATIMIIILCRQLANWLRWSVGQSQFAQRQKQKANMLVNMTESFISEIDKQLGIDFLAEESAQYSDMITRLLNLDDTDVNRVQRLIYKIEKEKSIKSA